MSNVKQTALEIEKPLASRFLSLDHPNPYIAFIKSALNAFCAAVTVVLCAEGFSWLIERLFSDDVLTTFLVTCFGYGATLVSFLTLLNVMYHEARVLIMKVRMLKDDMQ